MNVRAVVTVTACALALGAAAVPAEASSHTVATCDFARIKDMTVEQASASMPPALRDATRHDLIYSLIRHVKVEDLPAYYRDKVEAACQG